MFKRLKGLVGICSSSLAEDAEEPCFKDGHLTIILELCGQFGLLSEPGYTEVTRSASPQAAAVLSRLSLMPYQ